MKQVLAVRVGAKKAVGHIVSKRWWPTVRSGAQGIRKVGDGKFCNSRRLPCLDVYM